MRTIAILLAAIAAAAAPFASVANEAAPAANADIDDNAWDNKNNPFRSFDAKLKKLEEDKANTAKESKIKSLDKKISKEMSKKEKLRDKLLKPHDKVLEKLTKQSEKLYNQIDKLDEAGKDVSALEAKAKKIEEQENQIKAKQTIINDWFNGVPPEPDDDAAADENGAKVKDKAKEALKSML